MDLLANDLVVLRAAHNWLAQGARVALVTVVGTWGSSPRPPGSLLALADSGRLAGSVSGGCVEADLLERWQQGELQGKHPVVLHYGDNDRFHLPCGAALTLLLEPAPSPSALAMLVNGLAQRHLLSREVDIVTGKTVVRVADSREQIAFDGRKVRTIHGPSWRLLTIGATDIARYLTEIAPALDYEITVCDPRAEYRASWPVEGIKVDPGMPDDVVRAKEPDARTAVVALAHDPRLDDLALIEALATPAFYVGALGSETTNAKRRQRLLQMGLPEGSVARLHGPVGLAIGSRTPPEIAIAILAELTAIRRNVEVA